MRICGENEPIMIDVGDDLIMDQGACTPATSAPRLILEDGTCWRKDEEASRLNGKGHL